MSRFGDVTKFGNLAGGRPLFLFMAVALVVLLLSLSQAASASQKRVELILDASGSMNGRLNSGELKIDAAKKAVEMLVNKITPETILAFRAYGHRSHRNKKDCKDTELLVDFTPVSDNRDQVIAKAKALEAQGYTPITYVLQLAGDDFPKNADEEHIIVLVSDGKETCDGDPCATAMALVKSGVSELIIHTVGFGVDDTTRSQLECIARVSRGRYFSAASANELADALGTAVAADAVQETETVIVLKNKKELGFLKIISPDMMGHDVIDAETGEKVAWISNSNSVAKLKQGIYNVTVGAALWKSIEIKSGETTVIKPGRLTVKPAGLMGVRILDAETGVEQGHVSNSKNSTALMPGFYDVSFGKAIWSVEIQEGENKLLQPGIVKVVNAGVNFIHIRNSDGEKVGHVSNSLNSIPLPPGEYSIEIDKEQYEFSLKEAETKAFRLE